MNQMRPSDPNKLVLDQALLSLNQQIKETNHYIEYETVLDHLY